MCFELATLKKYILLFMHFKRNETLFKEVEVIGSQWDNKNLYKKQLRKKLVCVITQKNVYDLRKDEQSRVVLDCLTFKS